MKSFDFRFEKVLTIKEREKEEVFPLTKNQSNNSKKWPKNYMNF